MGRRPNRYLVAVFIRVHSCHSWPAFSGTPFASPSGMTWQNAWQLGRQTFSSWSADKAPKMAGALACFTILSLAPMLVIILKIASVRYGSTDAVNQLHDQLAQLTDPNVADAMRDLIPKTAKSGTGTIAATLSVLVALFGASGVFAELQDSLNTIWEVRPKPNRGFMGMVKDRFLSISMVFGIAFLLLVSMVVSSIITGASDWIIGHLLGISSGKITVLIAFVIDIVLSTAVVTVLFAAMFKVLPDATIKWGDVWLGAGVTAVLFQIGKYGLSLYIGLAKPGVAYGIAGSLVVLLIWIYYSSWILFLGAEFTRVYANQFGSKIVPSPNAEPLTKEMKQQAGIVEPAAHA
jgi:membrane protein